MHRHTWTLGSEVLATSVLLKELGICCVGMCCNSSGATSAERASSGCGSFSLCILSSSRGLSSRRVETSSEDKQRTSPRSRTSGHCHRPGKDPWDNTCRIGIGEFRCPGALGRNASSNTTMLALLCFLVRLGTKSSAAAPFVGVEKGVKVFAAAGASRTEQTKRLDTAAGGPEVCPFAVSVLIDQFEENELCLGRPDPLLFDERPSAGSGSPGHLPVRALPCGIAVAGATNYSTSR
jgi:hypothetical protein